MPASPSRDRILLVEDDDQIRMSLLSILEEEGFQVRGAREGGEGIDLIRTFHPHAIILDLALPGINGFDAAERLKSSTETSSIPLIAVTASWLGDDRERLRRIGFETSLRKPVPPEVLIEELRRVLGATAPTTRVATPPPGTV